MDKIMKSIIIYSGKGGVGKSTTTANLAKVLSSSGKRVFIIDADVNTPSMNIIFKTTDPEEGIRVSSMGFSTESMIYIEKSMVTNFIRTSLKEANKFKPDYILIDTPPSITDVHINLIGALSISGLIMVTQPNELSISDVNRTAMFFENRNIPVIGLVENMCSTKNHKPLEYVWPILASIPFVEEFQGLDAYEKYGSIYSYIVPKLENLDEIIIENKTKQIFDETIKFEDLNIEALKRQNRLKFVNVSTWEDIREEIFEQQNPMVLLDRFLDESTPERISRFVEAFKDTKEAYFIVSNAPAVGVDLITGEIGQGTLYIDEKFYGLPRLKYNTFQGEVTLFAHEVIPAKQDDIEHTLGTGGTIAKDGRYLPSYKNVEEIYNCFGARVGLTSIWPEKHNRIKNGHHKEELINE